MQEPKKNLTNKLSKNQQDFETKSPEDYSAKKRAPKGCVTRASILSSIEDYGLDGDMCRLENGTIYAPMGEIPLQKPKESVVADSSKTPLNSSQTDTKTGEWWNRVTKQTLLDDVGSSHPFLRKLDRDSSVPVYTGEELLIPDDTLSNKKSECPRDKWLNNLTSTIDMYDKGITKHNPLKHAAVVAAVAGLCVFGTNAEAEVVPSGLPIDDDTKSYKLTQTTEEDKTTNSIILYEVDKTTNPWTTTQQYYDLTLNQTEYNFGSGENSQTFEVNAPYDPVTITVNYGETSGRITSATPISNAVFASLPRVSKGGAVNISGGSMSIANTAFINNNVSGEGGAIYNDYGTISSIDNTVFIGNSATNAYSSGGAIMLKNPGATIDSITNSKFIGNYVTVGNGINALGGAISFQNGNYGSSGTITLIENTDFIGNHADTTSGYTQGGAIGIWRGGNIGTIRNSRFIGNYLYNAQDNTASEGGAIMNWQNSTIDLITESTFIGNRAGKAGAIHNNGGGTIGKIENSDFIGNSAAVRGGAIWQEGSGKINYLIDNTFVSNTAESEGGAIANAGTLTNGISNSTFVNNTSGGKGGAIYNEGTIGVLTNDTFINNSSSDVGGGAIYNSGTINKITGTKTAQTIDNEEVATYSSIFSGNSGNSGGAIYNSGTITNGISGTGFISNIAGTDGAGAIFNNGNLGVLSDSAFINNSSTGSYGGAITNYSNTSSKTAKIGDITNSVFIDNSAAFSGGAGAIYNNASAGTATIGNITGSTFAENITGGYGGAIYNSSTGTSTTVGNITNSTFSNNKANSNGGAIANVGAFDWAAKATIGDITDSSFMGNTAIGSGGAIYNHCYSQGTASIGKIQGTFTNNLAGGKGGAIYTSTSLNIISDNGTTIFQGNKQGAEFDEDGNYVEGTGESNAIYVANSNGTVTFDQKNNGVTTLNDKVQGELGYNVKITGDSTGTMNLYNDLENANVTAQNIKISTADGNVMDYNFKTFTSSDSAYYKVDLDYLDSAILKNDTFNVTDSGSGTVLLSELNNLNLTTDDVGNSYNFQILKTPSNSLQLVLAEALQNDNQSLKELSREIITSDVTLDVYFDDLYGRIQRVTSIAGNYALADTDTTHDTLQVNVTGITSTDTSLGDDLLKLWSEQSVEGETARNFNFKTANDVYTVIENLATTSAGVMNINGVYDETTGKRSTIDANGHQLFTVGSDSTLNVQNVEIKNGYRSGDSGGAISNYGTIGEITNSTFTSNRASQAAAIYNTGTIGDITNNTFTGNYSTSTDNIYGGTIYNSGKIGDITGDFTDNYMTSNYWSTHGGVIFNVGDIGDIEGNFSNNYIYNSRGSEGEALGGVISNGNYNDHSASITSLSGNFTSNNVRSKGDIAVGGVLYNHAPIGDISGTFTRNYASGYRRMSWGGAISNENTIDSIKGTFDGNMVANRNANALGGAIFTTGSGSIGKIQGTFTNNLAGQYGGAIYNGNNNLNIVAEDGDTLFSGNKQGVTFTFDSENRITGHSGGTSNAIYMESGTLNLNAAEGRTITFDDAIQYASSGQTVNINSASVNEDATQGTVVFNDSVNANAALYGGTLKLGSNMDSFNGSYSINVQGNSELDVKNGSVQVNAYNVDLNGQTLDYKLDIDGYNADKLYLASCGVVDITDINFINMPSSGSVVQVLTGATSGSTLTIAEALKSQDNVEFWLTGGSSNLTNHIKWSDELKNTEWEYKNIADLRLDTASSNGDGVLDSLEVTLLNVTPTGETRNEQYTIIPNNLKYINELEGERSFTATSADETYTVTEDLNQMAAGTLSINGVYDETTGHRSTINANGHRMFQVAEGSTLNLENVKITGGNNTSSGGAIYNEGILSAIGAEFNLNNTNWYGGAIANYGGQIDEIKADFTQNSATSIYSRDIQGGAIYNSGTIGAIESNFTNNSALGIKEGSYWQQIQSKGGAIYNGGTITDISGTFTNNSAGGYLSNDANGAVTGQGGAIYNSSNIGNISADFSYNTASGSSTSFSDGGAIYNARDAVIDSITESTFTGNSVDNAGGAISNWGTISSIEAEFIANNANSYGAAIANFGQIDEIKADFIHNTANTGSAIWMGYGGSSVSTISSIIGQFIENSANDYGAAITLIGGHIDEIKADFIGNTARVAGAIWNGGGSSENDISEILGEFRENCANEYGGAIVNMSGFIDTIKADFIGNKALGGDAGALDNSGNIYRIDGSTFKENTATGSGGAMGGGFRNGLGLITDAEFINNTAGENGGAISNTGTMGAILIYIDKYTDVNESTGESITYWVNNPDVLKNIEDAISHGYKIIITEYGGSYHNSTVSDSSFNDTKNKIANGEYIAVDPRITLSEQNNYWTPDTVAIQNTAFTGNIAANNGGAIFNAPKYTNDLTNIGSITNTTFTSNSATNGGGGAIYNKGTIGDITGSEFTSNTANQTSGGGGAIFNDGGTMGTISGTTFTDNTASWGGTIGNGGTIEGIDSSSISGGHAIYEGGAINNYGTITNGITNTTFTNNVLDSVVDDKGGGAIYNSNTIGDVSGTFKGNKAIVTKSNSENSIYYSYGGAIYNKGTMGTVSGTFEDNESVGILSDGANGNASGAGGAIYNASGHTIEGIENSVFKNNTTHMNTGGGGALLNQGTITNGITDTQFISNIASWGGAIGNGGTIKEFRNVVFDSNSAKYEGGAVNTYGTITNGFINNTFTDNKTATSKGGAIYVSSDTIKFVSDNGTTTFRGNLKNAEFDADEKYVAGTGTPNAIYMNNGSGTVTFELRNQGVTDLYDTVEGNTGYSVSITGDGTGTMNLYNDLTNAKVNVENVTVNTIDNNVLEYNFDTLTTDSSATYKLDIDFGSVTSDTFNVANSSNGTIWLSELNAMGIDEIEKDRNYSFQILKTTGNSLQLALTEALQGTEVELYTDTEIIGGAEVGPNVYYDDVSGQIARLTTYKGQYGLATTDTTNDTLEINVVGSSTSEQVVEGGDLLKSWSEQSVTEGTERNFNFRTAQDTYTVKDDLAATSAGVMNINGVYDETTGNRSTIDADGHSMFNVSSGSTLNLENVEITGGVAGYGNDRFGNGAAIINQAGGNIGTITNGKFTNNNTGDGAGGAIANWGKIDTILADFIENSSNCYGAAIVNFGNNGGHIGTINGLFEKNVSRSDGAIWNSGIIDSILGEFIENSVGYYGGAISNINGLIDNIKADFTRNIATYSWTSPTTEETYNYGAGGAIFNGAIINSIIGEFRENSANDYGGAIWNNGNIGSIKADFLRNSAGDKGGGAIYNQAGSANFSQGVIGDIEDSTFISNTTTGTGGAIAINNGLVGNISNTEFRENIAGTHGGAIYNSGVFVNNSADRVDIVLGKTTYTKTSTGETITVWYDGSSYGGTLVSKINNALENGKKINFYNQESSSSVSDSDWEYLQEEIERGRYTTTDPTTLLSEDDYWVKSDKAANITDSTFIGNTASSFGGAIYNEGTIGDIKGTKTTEIVDGEEVTIYTSSFTNNSSTTGGAISNYGIIGDITGTAFIDNNALHGGQGGAIYNSKKDSYSNSAIIGDITSSLFEGNSTISSGGAIYNYYSEIGNIVDSSFVSNSTNSAGGAIYNHGTIGDISGSEFISNTGYFGGAISIDNGIVGDITNSTFTNNSAISQGGAICNWNGTIGDITNSTFTSNVAGDKGGAIYTTTDINIISNNGETTFSGNKQGAEFDQDGKYVAGTGESNAIYVANSNGTVTFDQKNNGVTTLNDKVQGESGYNVKITGDTTGQMNLYNDLENANVTVEKTTLNTADGELKEYNFKTLNSDTTAEYKVDINFTTNGSDKIKTAENSTGKVLLSDLNVANGANITTDKTYEFQILETPTDDLQLELSEDLQNETLEVSSTTVEIEQGPTANVNYDDEYGVIERTTNYTGNYALKTTDTTNDTLTLSVTETSHTDTEKEKYDTLKAWSEQQIDETEERNFNFRTSEDRYDLSQNLSTTSNGTMNINGVRDGETRSIIDGNGYKMFTVSNDTTLNVTDTKITNGTTETNGGVINNNGNVTLTNTEITNNIAGNKGGAVYTTTDINIISDNGTTVFSGNKQGAEFNQDGNYVSGTGESNAIYVANSNGTVTFDQKNNGVTTLNDKVQGESGYNVKITGDTTGQMNLYNDLENANVTVEKTTLNTADGELKEYNFKTLTSDTTAEYKIDLNFETMQSDTFKVTEDSTGKVVLSDVNATGTIYADGTNKFQVIKTTTDTLQLGLTEELEDKELAVTDLVTYEPEHVTKDVQWDDEFGGVERTQKFKGNYEVTTTDTTNDTLSVKLTQTSDTSEWKNKVDTLKAWSENNEVTGERNFNFASATDTYELTENMTTTSAGVTMNINGVQDGETRSTIDGKEHKMFTVSNDTTLNVTDTKITNGSTGTNGGVIDNNGTVNLTNVLLNANRAASQGGAIYNVETGTVNLASVMLEDNYSGEELNDIHNDGLMNVKAGTTVVNSGVTGSGNTIVQGGDLVIADGSNGFEQKTLTVTSGSVTSNADNLRISTGAISNEGTLNLTGGTNNNVLTGNGLTKITGDVTNANVINQKELTIAQGGKLSTSLNNITVTSNTVKNDGTFEITSGNEIRLDVTKDTTGGGVVNFKSGDMHVNSTISDNTVVFNSGNLTFANPASNIATSNLTMNGGNLNMINNQTQALAMQKLTLNNDMNMSVDVDLANKSMDRITAQSYEMNNHKVKVTGMNLLSDAENETTRIQFAEEGMKNNVENKVNELGKDVPNDYQTTMYAPIYKYTTSYSTDDGNYTFVRGAGTSSNPSDSFNPAILNTPVVQQSNILAIQNTVTNYAFHHVDTNMAPSIGKISSKYANRYALGNDQVIKDDLNTNNPLFVKPESQSVWVKPFVTFENVPLKNGPKVNSINYGTLVGYDSNPIYHKNGIESVWTGYVGYTGSTTNYTGVDNVSNGGLLGATYSLYKGNFFNATTVTAGATMDQATTMYGKDNIGTLYAGVGNKLGYNFEFKDGLFTLQPNLLLSYTFGKTFNYTNAAGVRITSEPIHSIQISPGVKFYMNTKNGWQPYLGVNMMWSIMDQTHVKANGVKLPEMSVRPYVQYGVGIQKTIEDSFTAYLQAMVQNGGRNGISLTGGMKWMLGGKGASKPAAQKTNNL